MGRGRFHFLTLGSPPGMWSFSATEKSSVQYNFCQPRWFSTTLEVPSLGITLPRAWFNWFGSGPGRQYDPEALQMILICCQVENS